MPFNLALAISLAVPVFAQQPPTPGKKPLKHSPSSMQLLNNALIHLKDAKHALSEASADTAGHKNQAMRLVDGAMNEVEAAKKAYVQEVKEIQEEKQEE